jgi:hypothetical protein
MKLTMKTSRSSDPWIQPAWAVIISLLLCLTALLLRPCVASADMTPSAELSKEQGRVTDPALLLARAVAGEASLTASPAEVEAIGYVLMRRGMFYSAALRLCKRPWVCALEVSETASEYWPEHLSWDVWGPHFERIYRHSQRVLSGEVVAMCRPDHFGSSDDAHRAYDGGWQPVFCGRCSNYYWRLP